MSSEYFELGVVHDNFTNSLINEDDVKLEEYLASFDELNKFFNLLGTIFGFVSKDLRDKMAILRQFLIGPDGDNFNSVKVMIEYEKQNNLLEKHGYTSGCRTLLRIHRGLDFIQLFLKTVNEIKDEAGTSGPCREAYDRTLAKHHSFFIRKAAHLAMYSLPSKKQLLVNVCGTDENIKSAKEILPDVLDVMLKVFDRVEALYTLHQLHSLP